MAASSLLIMESPLTVLPSLAVRIGLNEAIFLQQVQYWISREAGFCDEYGRRWIYNTVKQWNVQFPFWSESTIKRTIRSLEKQHVLLSTLIGNAFNKTKAYTIDYERIEALNEEIVHEQVRASIESVQQRVSAPPPMRNVGMAYTEESSASDVLESEYQDIDTAEDDEESQNIKSSDPHAEVKTGLHECQDEPHMGGNLTLTERSAETPVTARVCVLSSRARVTETTTENTHRIRETTTGDVRSFCAALGISGTSLETFIRRYGEEKVRDKARLLEIAMQTKCIRNPTGWLHAALKDDYTFSPVTPRQESTPAQTQPSGRYVPPVPPPAPTPKEQKQEVRQNLHEFLTRQAAADGEGSVFAQEFLRRHGIVDGRASP